VVIPEKVLINFNARKELDENVGSRKDEVLEAASGSKGEVVEKPTKLVKEVV